MLHGKVQRRAALRRCQCPSPLFEARDREMKLRRLCGLLGRLVIQFAALELRRCQLCRHRHRRCVAIGWKEARLRRLLARRFGQCGRPCLRSSLQSGVEPDAPRIAALQRTVRLPGRSEQLARLRPGHRSKQDPVAQGIRALQQGGIRRQAQSLRIALEPARQAGGAAGHDQAVLRPRHGDIEHAHLLRNGLLIQSARNGLPRNGRAKDTRCGVIAV